MSGPHPSLSSRMRKFAAWAAPYLKRSRGPAIVALLVLSVAALAYTLVQWRAAARENQLIGALQSGQDVAVDARRSSGEAVVARAAFLLERDRYDEAQELLDAARPTASSETGSRLLYNQANANVRRAFKAIESGKPDQAIPLVKLAKDAYRAALRLAPGDWDAKHNYDVAMRLVRDFPEIEQDGEEVPPDAKVKLWTDLPGVPKGAP